MEEPVPVPGITARIPHPTDLKEESMEGCPRALITGGAGFIGSALARYLVENRGWDVIVLDKLTYAGNFSSLRSIQRKSNFRFVRADICDSAKIDEVFL